MCKHYKVKMTVISYYKAVLKQLIIEKGFDLTKNKN
jgi:hypothetical protein